MLKYIKGDVFSTDHWHDMFRLLGMPHGTTLEKLTFADLLQNSSSMMNASVALKDLYSRAQGEVSIREAFKELEMWGASSEFVLTDYEDSQGKKLMIIKEWKEIINQVNELCGIKT